MIADWTVDIGPESPSIDVPWEGWVDLLWDPGSSELPWRDALARGLPEVQLYPELLPSLQLLNRSNHFTSKVDVFAVQRSEVDPELAESCPPEAALGLASYIDVLNAVPGRYREFAEYEATARAAVKALARAPSTLGGAEIVIRPASLAGDAVFGWTLYAFGFGVSIGDARTAWARALGLLAFAFVKECGSVTIDSSAALLKGAAPPVQTTGE